MRALVKTAPAPGLELLDVPEPTPTEGQVLIRVEVAPVCGSDVARYAWTRNYHAGQPKDMTRDLPRILGHEFAGTIIAVGPRVSTLTVGDRVAICNILGCGLCAACRDDEANVCDDRRTIGVHVDGGFAEKAVVPAANCTPIPADMSLHLAALLQPFAVGTHAVAKVAIEPGDRVAVWGLGAIGMAICVAAQLRGAQVVGFDRVKERVRVAGEAGVLAELTTEHDVHAVLATHGGPRACRAFFDAAGAAEEILGAVRFLAKRAPIVLVGNLAGPTTADLMPVVMDEHRILGSRSHSRRSWEIAVRTASRGYEAAGGDEVPLDGALARFEAARHGGGQTFAILPNV